MISSLGLERRSSDTAPRFMGLMELAKKYEIEAVRAFVTQHIKNDWPTTLEEWQGQQAEIARLEEEGESTAAAMARLGLSDAERMVESSEEEAE